MIDSEVCIDLLKEELENKGSIEFIVHGNSMLPTIKNGDVIAVEKCNQYKIGDIVAYYTVVENKIKIVIHRLIFVRRSYVLAKGDNNDFIDPVKILIENIIGRSMTF